MEIVLTHLDPITVNVTLDSRGLLRSKHASVKQGFCAEKTVLWDSQQGCWSYRELTKTRHEKLKHSCIVDLFCNALGESPFQHKHCAHVEHRQCRIWLRNPSVCLLCPDNMASSSQYRQHCPSLSLRFLVIFNYCFLWAPLTIQHQIVPCLHAESHASPTTTVIQTLPHCWCTSEFIYQTTPLLLFLFAHGWWLPGSTSAACLWS